MDFDTTDTGLRHSRHLRQRVHLMTRFPIHGLWHVEICHVIVIIVGNAEQGAVSF